MRTTAREELNFKAWFAVQELGNSTRPLTTGILAASGLDIPDGCWPPLGLWYGQPSAVEVPTVRPGLTKSVGREVEPRTDAQWPAANRTGRSAPARFALSVFGLGANGVRNPRVGLVAGLLHFLRQCP